MISQLPGIYQIRNTANGKVYVGSAAALTGITRSAETRAKMSAARRARA